MTHDRMASASDLTDELRARGYRATTQRRLILDAVRELDHSTPEDITEYVQRSAPSVNVSTVYRTLDLLEELGLVTHTHLGHGAPTYHSADESAHLHLVCHQCGQVEQVDVAVAEPLVGSLRASLGFEVDVAHVAIQGLCARCLAEEA